MILIDEVQGPVISRQILFTAEIRRLVDGTKAVVSSVFRDVEYDEKTDTIICRLHDVDGLSIILTDCAKYAPCKMDLTWV